MEENNWYQVKDIKGCQRMLLNVASVEAEDITYDAVQKQYRQKALSVPTFLILTNTD